MRDYFINDEYAEKKLVPMSQECPRRLLSMIELEKWFYKKRI